MQFEFMALLVTGALTAAAIATFLAAAFVVRHRVLPEKVLETLDVIAPAATTATTATPTEGAGTPYGHKHAGEHPPGSGGGIPRREVT